MIHAIKQFVYNVTYRKKSRTVRHTFSIATVAIVALMATALLSQNDSYIRLVVPDEPVVAGETFVAEVYVGAAQSVNAIDVVLAYPDTRLEVQGIDTGNSVISIWTEEPFVEGNTIVLRGGTFRRGFIGEHLIASIRLEAKVSGRAELSVAGTTLLAGDGNGTEVTNVAADPVTIVAVNEDGQLAADVELYFITDIDGNGSVTLSDVEAFITAWREKNWRYDFNGDSRMNFTDFAIILADSFFN